MRKLKERKRLLLRRGLICLLLLALLWVNSGFDLVFSGLEADRSARRYMAEDMHLAGRGSSGSYVYAARDEVILTRHRSFTRLCPLEDGAMLCPTADLNWGLNRDTSEPFPFTAYCERSGAVRADLELDIHNVRSGWHESYHADCESLDNGIAVFGLTLKHADAIGSETNPDGNHEFSAFHELRHYPIGMVVSPAWSMSATVRYYDASGALLSETSIDF